MEWDEDANIQMPLGLCTPTRFMHTHTLTCVNNTHSCKVKGPSPAEGPRRAPGHRLPPQRLGKHCSCYGFDFLKKISLTDDSLIRQTSEVCGDEISINYLSNSPYTAASTELKLFLFLLIFFKRENTKITVFPNKHVKGLTLIITAINYDKCYVFNHKIPPVKLSSK